MKGQFQVIKNLNSLIKKIIKSFSFVNVGESPKERLLINHPESPGQTHMCALNNSTFIQRGFVEYLLDRCCNPGKFHAVFRSDIARANGGFKYKPWSPVLEDCLLAEQTLLISEISPGTHTHPDTALVHVFLFSFWKTAVVGLWFRDV